jgi:hypothetical protein
MAVSSATTPDEPVSNACSTSSDTTNLSPYCEQKDMSEEPFHTYKDRILTQAAFAFASVDKLAA